MHDVFYTDLHHRKEKRGHQNLLATRHWLENYLVLADCETKRISQRDMPWCTISLTNALVNPYIIQTGHTFGLPFYKVPARYGCHSLHGWSGVVLSAAALACVCQ